VLPVARFLASHAETRCFRSAGMHRPRRVPIRSNSRRKTAASCFMPTTPADLFCHVTTGCPENLRLTA
jgi:hypothetical protein